jgi:predicted dienelactone hydrolase
VVGWSAGRVGLGDAEDARIRTVIAAIVALAFAFGVIEVAVPAAAALARARCPRLAAEAAADG